MMLALQIVAGVLMVLNLVESKIPSAIACGLCLIVTFWIQEDIMKLHKEQLNECHILRFENGILYIQIGQDWEVVELWNDKLNCFYYVFKGDL